MSSSKRKVLTDEEIAELAKSLRVADPTKDNGAFSAVSKSDALTWLRLMDVKGLDPKSLSVSEVLEKLELALWDSQRYTGSYFFTQRGTDDQTGSIIYSRMLLFLVPRGSSRFRLSSPGTGGKRRTLS